MNYYQETKDSVLKSVNTAREGLSQSEAEKRLEENGYNEISRKDKKSIFTLFIESFKDPMVIVLLIVAIVQVAIGEWIESLIIFVVLILNAILSVVQTKKAEDSLESLEKMSAPSANVYRNGSPKEIEARNLAVGDIVVLEAGDNIPADGRLIEAESLQVEEGALTGESMPSEKTIEPLKEDTPLADRINMVYSSTLVTAGRGVMVVTSTGEETEMGKVAELVQSASAKQTPLQRKLAQFSKKLGVAILLLSILIFGIQAARIFLGDTQDVTVPLLNAFMFAAAVAVAAIPEALQSIVTIVLSVGTNKMAKQNAIIRQLPAVETLGSTSVICTDKTGTLTQNKMTVV
ncbi:MAG: HAD-IC family P-type ATPase, partial [Alkalibacterium sp.]